MFIFQNLPSEVNWIIQIEHKRKFILVVNVINQFPKFIEQKYVIVLRYIIILKKMKKIYT